LGKKMHSPRIALGGLKKQNRGVDRLETTSQNKNGGAYEKRKMTANAAAWREIIIETTKKEEKAIPGVNLRRRRKKKVGGRHLAVAWVCSATGREGNKRKKKTSRLGEKLKQKTRRVRYTSAGAGKRKRHSKAHGGNIHSEGEIGRKKKTSKGGISQGKGLQKQLPSYSAKKKHAQPSAAGGVGVRRKSQHSKNPVASSRE